MKTCENTICRGTIYFFLFLRSCLQYYFKKHEMSEHRMVNEHSRVDLDEKSVCVVGLMHKKQLIFIDLTHSSRTITLRKKKGE